MRREAGTISDALELLGRTKPRLALVDISLQNQSGLELIHLIKSEYPETLMLVVSMHEENLYGNGHSRRARRFCHETRKSKRSPRCRTKSAGGHIAVSEDLRQRMLEVLLWESRMSTS
jgi:DNA-binding NarL/FixJ family response regulator